MLLTSAHLVGPIRDDVRIGEGKHACQIFRGNGLASRPGHRVQQEHGWETQLPPEMVHNLPGYSVVGGEKAAIYWERRARQERLRKP